MNRNQQAQAAGMWGEKKAAAFLREKGYKILGVRVMVGKHDELDLIARDGEVLVFVEVKTRSGEGFGRPLSAVDPRKRHALSRGAVHYLKSLRRMPAYFRFDVVEVVGEAQDDEVDEIRHIEQAFALDTCYRLVY